MNKILLPGSEAPDFTLKNQDDQPVTLSEVLLERPVMLIFYPKDIAEFCAKEICSFNSHLFRFVKYKLQLFGISTYSPGLQKKIAEKYEFGFPLLSDENKEVTNLYGVSSIWTFGGMSRAVFVISKKRIILYRHVEPTIIKKRNPNEVLNALEDLRKHEKL